MNNRIADHFKVTNVVTKLRSIREDLEAIDHHQRERIVQELDEVIGEFAYLLDLVGVE